jgi:hypothetical protein
MICRPGDIRSGRIYNAEVERWEEGRGTKDDMGIFKGAIIIGLVLTTVLSAYSLKQTKSIRKELQNSDPSATLTNTNHVARASYDLLKRAS